VLPALSPIERMSVVVTCALALICIAAAWIGYAARAPFAMAVAVGCIGGLVHELFQSGGTVLFFVRREDGLYLGSLAGILLGGVSGLLSAHGVVTADAVQLQGVAYDAFFAGVGLKGLAEAAAGRSVPAREQTPPAIV
jgi:hypothetical protein